MNIVNELSAEQLAYWTDTMPARPVVMRAPEGMEDCADCTSVVTHPVEGETVVRTAWKPDEIELAHLARGGTIWLSTWGGLPPHMLEVQAPVTDVESRPTEISDWLDRPLGGEG